MASLRGTYLRNPTTFYIVACTKARFTVLDREKVDSSGISCPVPSGAETKRGSPVFGMRLMVRPPKPEMAK